LTRPPLARDLAPTRQAKEQASGAIRVDASGYDYQRSAQARIFRWKLTAADDGPG